MKHNVPHAAHAQLGFDTLLAEAEHINKAAAFEKETAHLPRTMKKAIPFYRTFIEWHHAAMLAADSEIVSTVREEAAKLARKLNNGQPGILAGPDAPGCVLARETAAPDGTIPLWGQTGSFIITVGSMRVRIDMDGLFGIGAQFTPWINFGAHAVDWDKPFLSETGYRSYMGRQAALVPGLTPETFAVEVISGYVKTSLKGRLSAIRPPPSRK